VPQKVIASQWHSYAVMIFRTLCKVQVDKIFIREHRVWHEAIVMFAWMAAPIRIQKSDDNAVPTPYTR
jgi:hypothetical protein